MLYDGWFYCHCATESPLYNIFFVLKYVFMTTGKIIKEYLSNGTIQQGEFRLWNYDVLTSKVYLYKKWEK